MTGTIPSDLECIDKMCKFFDRLVSVEEVKGNLVYEIDDGKGNTLIKFKAVKYGGKWNLHYMNDKGLSQVQLFDIVYGSMTIVKGETR